MKRNVLVIMITALFVTTVNSAEIYNQDGNQLDFYGKMKARHHFTKKDSHERGDNSNFTLGIKGNVYISDEFRGYGHFALNTNTNTTEDESIHKNKLAYIGFSSPNYGSIDYGRNYGVLRDISVWTNISPLFNLGYIRQSDSYMVGLNRNLLTYRTADFFGLVDGLNFALQYQGKNKNNNSGSKDILKNNGSGWGLSVQYDVGDSGVTLGLGYIRSNTIIPLNLSQEMYESTYSDHPQGWNLGVKYKFNNLYTAAIYGEHFRLSRIVGDFDRIESDIDNIGNKTENLELVAQYSFDDLGLKPSISYIESTKKDNGNVLSRQKLLKYISLGTYYNFNKNLVAVVDYKMNLINNNEFTQTHNIGTDSVFGVGLIYQF
ncbi:MAG: porin [Arsenophonus sp.]|nr:MAG: porin [Arsenophonus sp.]